MGQLKENSSTEGPSKVTPRVRSQPDKHNRSSMEGLKPVSLVVSLPSRRELSVVKQSRGDAESDGGIPSISVSGYTYVSECGARQSFNSGISITGHAESTSDNTPPHVAEVNLRGFQDNIVTNLQNERKK